MKKIIALICCLASVFCFSSCSKEYSSVNEADYPIYLDEICDAELHMPKLENLGDYNSVLITRKTPNDIFISTTDSIALIVQYDQHNFEIATNSIDAKYDFIEFPLENCSDFNANVAGYTFRVDSNSLYKMTEYPSNRVVYGPECSLIIGVNALENKIAYLYYWDIEIHEMNDLDEFIEKKFVLE